MEYLVRTVQETPKTYSLVSGSHGLTLFLSIEKSLTYLTGPEAGPCPTKDDHLEPRLGAHTQHISVELIGNTLFQTQSYQKYLLRLVPIVNDTMHCRNRAKRPLSWNWHECSLPDTCFHCTRSHHATFQRIEATDSHVPDDNSNSVVVACLP